MDADFWHQRWQQARIGFHLPSVNPYLTQYWSALTLSSNAKVLVPLCGKTLDLAWLSQQGYQVQGVELSPVACQQFFAEQSVEAVVDQWHGFERYSAGEFQLLCGDFFALPVEELASVAAIYDRAALVALPRALRQQYAAYLSDHVQPGVQILLVSLQFEGEQGPPFSVSDDEVMQLFAARFEVQLLGSDVLEERGGMEEKVWRLCSR